MLKSHSYIEMVVLVRDVLAKVSEYNGSEMLDGYLNPIGEEFNTQLAEFGLPTIELCNQEVIDTDEELARRELTQALVAEGADEGCARQSLDCVVDHCNVRLVKIVGCTAVYNSGATEDSIRILNVSGDETATIYEWVGELNHSVSPTMNLLSLIYNSEYSLKDLGLE